MRFASLHHHSTYSYGDGFGTPAAHARRAAELGMSTMALTEHGNTSSAFVFEQAAAKASIKPIFGIEAYTGPTDLETRGQYKWHLSILASDATGYRNLNEMVTQSYKDFHYHPTVSGANLAAHADGLICLSGCSGSYLACALLGGKGVAEHPPDRNAAQRAAERFLALFGDRYYLEVQAFPELPRICAQNVEYERLSRVTGIPLVATLDCHYPEPSDSDMQTILHAAHRGNQSFDDAARSWNYDVKLTLPPSDRELWYKLRDTGLSYEAAYQAIENAAGIGERCNVTLPKAERLRYPGTDDATAEIWEWLRAGWRFRKIGGLLKYQQEWYRDRVKYEMELILDKDFADFFLATADVVQFAKNAGIPVGPGRGSAAASVVCYLLRITEVPPHRYPGMLFERFLDATRMDPPDIDLDFSDERRHEVREYLAGKYGDACVGTIGNFVGYRSKNALQDVARVYRIPKATTKIVSELVIERSGGDSRYDDTLEDTVNMFPVAKEIFDGFPDLWQATRLQGNVRGMSIHAAGLVVSNTPLTDICAVYERDGRQVLSIDKHDAEYAGMLKMDFLGLTTLGIIARCLELTGVTLQELYDIPDTDPETLEVFRSGDVIGVFQFEGRATRLVNRDVHPDNFGEVIDISALSRPGPLFSATTAEYCDVKHGRRKAEQYHPVVDKITKATKGQIIYQEQILQIVREVGGFSWTHAAEIRRIIAKKTGQAAFNVSLDEFVTGAERLHGIPLERATHVWNKLITSGTYAFNIAHSTSYSLLSWWCAWLKVHYPVEFYAASLARTGTADEMGFKLMKDADQHGVRVLPPDLNSDVDWSIDSAGVRAGFKVVPGIAELTAQRIVADRAEHGPFNSWSDLTRVKGIGEKTAGVCRDFATRPDPFGLKVARTRVEAALSAVEAGELPGVPRPEHNCADVFEIVREDGYIEYKSKRRGSKVCFAALVRNIRYQDAIENARSRSGAEVDDIKKRMKRPDLSKFVILECYDHTNEEVYARVNRFGFPDFRAQIANIVPDHDIVIIKGSRAPGVYTGTPVVIDEMWVVDPDD